jgi:serine/threonine-protein kinase
MALDGRGVLMSVAAAQLLHRLVQSGLFDHEQLAELIRSCYWGEFPKPEVVRQSLIERGWLTGYQLSELSHGRGSQLRVGRYLLQEKLGDGHFGRVFRARDTRMLRDVSLKKLHPEMTEDPGITRRFLREIVLLGQLKNKHLIFALDADCIGEVWFIVYEYVKGFDLQQLVRPQGPLPWQATCEYARQAAEGLKYIWELGMTHRDIKPANLVVEEGTTTVKILDFGLAKAEEYFPGYSQVYSLSTSGTVLGTPDFMAPEQFQSAREVDIRSDLYSLGCTLYFLLTGRPPFPGLSATQLLHAVLHEEPEPIVCARPDAPRQLVEIVTHLMAKRPEARFQDPGQVVTALEKVLTPPLALPVCATGGREQETVEYHRDGLGEEAEKTNTASADGAT